MMEILAIKKLATHYTVNKLVVVAVDHVDLLVKERQIVGIVGESGSGKSTIANSILRILPETGKLVSGSVMFKDADLTELNEREMQHRIRGNEISMIFQDPMVSLNPVFTVGSQIVDVMKLHQACRTREAKIKAIDLFKRIGISDPESRFYNYPHELSGGMIQRVVIAMSMSCQPSLIIADEPTTALDVTIQNQILNEFETLVREMGISVMWISHDLGIIRRISDYVYVMYAGQILEEGSVEAIFQNPLHPYTQGLLEANPIYHEPKSEIPTIRGELSEMTSQGCIFYPRCQNSNKVCSTEDIALAKVAESHYVRCKQLTINSS